MFINGVDLSLYSAEVTDDFEVGPASVSSNYVLGGDSTTPLGFNFRSAARPITLPIAFVCATTKEAVIQRSKVQEELLMRNTVELYDEDNDIFYSAVLNEVSDENFLMEGVIVVTFKLYGIAHGKKVVVEQTDSFIPEGVCKQGQDCRISVTVKTLESDGSYKIGGITFFEPKVAVGQEIVIDGFEKKVYVNGGSAMDFCDIIKFPKLTPGVLNYIECKDQLTIEYYPVYK